MSRYRLETVSTKSQERFTVRFALCVKRDLYSSNTRRFIHYK